MSAGTNVAQVPTLRAKPKRKLNTRARMAAAVIAAPRKIDIVSVPVPEPRPGKIVVRLEGCGVCASNIPVWHGKPWFAYPLEPGAPGHEAWGRVKEIGDGVSSFQQGDRVAVLSTRAYAEYDVCEASSAVKVPAALDGQPFPGEPLACAFNIFCRSNIDKSQSVAIVGIGFLGALLTQLSSTLGARVIAVTRRQFALDLARQMGAAHTIALDDHARVVDEVVRLTNGALCDVVIECTGKQEPLDLSAQLTRERGGLVIAGYHQDGARQINMQLWNWRGLDVINAHERDPRVYVDGMRQAIHAVATGLLNPAPLYTHRFSLGQLGEALETAAERPDGFMKALIKL
jgi:2-desacetyl-2-hydroxyethyl bacteriochlorophyllide A dehydrogenase